MDVYLHNKRVRLDPSASIGKGGEADVFDLGDGTVLKLFKAPDHPDYAGLPADQDAARARLEAHQTKLRAFPKRLPERVVAPIDLAFDRRGARVLGFTMLHVSAAEVLLRYADPGARSGGLALANREVTRPLWDERRIERVPGLLDDDTTVVVVRRRPG